MQALECNHPLATELRATGVDNDAFIADEDVERILGKYQYSLQTLKRGCNNTPIVESHEYLLPNGFEIASKCNI